jgi:hypothetical protein
MNRSSLVVVAVGLAACAHPVRFADRAILWRDPDDAPVPMPSLRPAPPGGRLWPGANNAIFRPADRLLNVDYGLEAVNVNALDEVPTSSWYEDPRRDPANPAAAPRALSAEELARGVRRDDPAEPPFVIVAGLDGGSAGGFVVEDARRRRFVLKLDPEGHPGLVTGADAVTTRLAWASGWRVPADDLLDVAREELRVRPGATMANQYGKREPLDEGDVDSVLRHSVRGADGRYRAVTSRWIEGKVLGPPSFVGRDRSDGNDRYAHENRRDLRGFGVWAAWVDDVDVIENNTLDSYVGERGRGHVVHYQLDVGGSFGAFSAAPAHYWMGDQSYFQAGRIIGAFLTLGLVRYRWEDERWQRRRRALVEQYPEFGGYSAQHFDPRAWRPIVDIPAFVRQTRRDRYWGAKRVAAFSREELAAVVAAGGYRPAAAAYLTETLWRRRIRIALDAFGETAALDHFAVAGERLCFVDLWVRAGLGGGDGTEYRARQDERVIAAARGAAVDGGVCVTLPALDGYRVVALAARRPGERGFGRPVEVHLIEHAGRARVLGVVH